MNGLDPIATKHIRELLYKLNKEEGVTIFLSSHILGELTKLCTKFGFIRNGKLLKEVSKEEMFNNKQNGIKIEVNNTFECKKILEKSLNIKDIRIAADNSLEIYGYSSKMKISKICIENNIEIIRLCDIENNIEDYLIELIGGK